MKKGLWSKKMSAYLVFTADGEKNLLTVLEKKSQIQEYTRSRIIADHWTHYKEWCNLHGHVPSSPQAKDEYINSYMDNASSEEVTKYTYWVEKVYFTKSSLISGLRMLYGCIPLGCSYENEHEVDYAAMLYSTLQKKQG